MALSQPKRHKYVIVDERPEQTGERIYNAAGRGNGRRVKPPVRNWYLKKVPGFFGQTTLIQSPRMITTVRLVDHNKYDGCGRLR